jgi:hypothetical protein
MSVSGWNNGKFMNKIGHGQGKSSMPELFSNQALTLHTKNVVSKAICFHNAICNFLHYIGLAALWIT